MDNFDQGLTELAASLRTTGLKRNAGCASFVLRTRDELIRLQRAAQAWDIIARRNWEVGTSMRFVRGPADQVIDAVIAADEELLKQEKRP